MMLEYVVVCYVDSGADSVTCHSAVDEKEAYLNWVRELNCHFHFEPDFEYIYSQKPVKIEEMLHVWEVSFTYGSDYKHCIVRIIGRKAEEQRKKKNH